MLGIDSGTGSLLLFIQATSVSTILFQTYYQPIGCAVTGLIVKGMIVVIEEVISRVITTLPPGA